MLTDIPVLLFWTIVLFILIMEFVACLDIQFKKPKPSKLLEITSIILLLAIVLIWYGLTHQADSVAIFAEG
jgi:hypothetical protein